jgi:IS30 family transposase
MTRGKELSQEKRAQIIALHSHGQSQRQIAASLNVSKTAVHKALVRHAELGTFNSKRRCGRPLVTTSQTDHAIRRAAVKDPTTTSTEIAAQ